jgi:hypothetical protein
MEGKMVAGMPFCCAGEIGKPRVMCRGCAVRKKTANRMAEKLLSGRPVEMPAPWPSFRYPFDRPPFKLLFKYCFDSR